MSFSPKGDYLAVAKTTGGGYGDLSPHATLTVVDTETGANLSQQDVDSHVEVVVWARDSILAATGSEILVLDPVGVQEPLSISGRAPLASDPGGDLFIFADVDDDTLFHLRSFSAGSTDEPVRVDAAPSAISLAGSTIRAVYDDQWVEEIDTRTGLRRRHRFQTHPSDESELVLSPDGRYIGATRGTQITVFDAATGTPHRRFKDSEIVTALGFSPNSRYLITGRENGSSMVWAID